MNRFAVLAVFIVALVSMEVARGCDTNAAMKCTTTYNTDSTKVKDDKSKFCPVVNDFKDCLKDAKCLDENQEEEIRKTLKDLGYTCGASMWTANMVLIFTTLFVTLKNFF